MVEPIYLLDTNTWIFALKGKPIELVQRLGKIPPTSVTFCSVVKAELLRGAYRYGNQEARLVTLQNLFSLHRSFPTRNPGSSDWCDGYADRSYCAR
jgi:predicted nucleic acid-binding protein